jgi:hypothetical protein
MNHNGLCPAKLKIFDYFNLTNKTILNDLIGKLVSLNLYKYDITDNNSYFLINIYQPNKIKHIYIKKSNDLFMYYFDNPVIYIFNNDLDSFINKIKIENI